MDEDISLDQRLETRRKLEPAQRQNSPLLALLIFRPSCKKSGSTQHRYVTAQ